MTLRTILGAIALLAATPAIAEPATVYFPSADGDPVQLRPIML